MFVGIQFSLARELTGLAAGGCEIGLQRLHRTAAGLGGHGGGLVDLRDLIEQLIAHLRHLGAGLVHLIEQIASCSNQDYHENQNNGYLWARALDHDRRRSGIAHR